jgi:hypothetical protein
VLPEVALTLLIGVLPTLALAGAIRRSAWPGPGRRDTGRLDHRPGRLDRAGRPRLQLGCLTVGLVILAVALLICGPGSSRPPQAGGRDMGRQGRTGLALLASATVAWAATAWLGRTLGSTRQERRRMLPGDELVAAPNTVTNHAVTIPAPPKQVWPWLVQVGWHRGGWYTPRWVDRLLFPANWASASRLEPSLQRPLAVGDHVPDGPPGTAWFEVAQVDPPRLLVLHSTTHLPASWQARTGASIDWTWTFALAEDDTGCTRLVLRVRGRTEPWWLTAAYNGAIVPADLVMATSMLAGIRARVLRQPAGTTACMLLHARPSPVRSPVPAVNRARGGDQA